MIKIFRIIHLLHVKVCRLLRKIPKLYHRGCPEVTVPASSLKFEAVVFVSIFFLFSTIFFIIEMTLGFFIADNTVESNDVVAFSKHKKSTSLFDSNSNCNN